MTLTIRFLLPLLLACLAGLANATEPGVPISGKALIDELRKGGYIVYFRHTKTLPQHEHEARMWREGRWRAEDCSTQRNLSEAGLAEANDQRDWIAMFRIPFGRVYASSACRARIHAERVARGAELIDVLTPPRSREKGLTLRAMLNTAPAPGTNTFMFAHGGILWNATDYDSVESETFVFRPAAPDRPPTLVASIKFEDWARLARGEACCAPRAFWSGTGEPPTE
ncbi:MAG: hypothetical protein JNM79_12365 [Burkholderiales bacterium]|nr:hypothetical protein [Burkholderiales bacterium]